MTRITKFSIIGIIGLALIGGAVACSHHYKDPEQRAQWMQGKISDELNLNETQQAKLQNLFTVMMQVRQEMKAEFADDHQNIDKLLQHPTLDRGQMLSMVNKHTASMNENAPRVIDAMADFYDSLDEQQRAQLREHMQEMREHHGGHGFGHGEHHGMHD